MKLVSSLCLLFMLAPNMAFSENLEDCSVVTIDRIYGQATHSHPHNNKMILSFSGGQCSINTAYIANTEAAHDSILSIALAAYMSGKGLRVTIDTDDVVAGAARITSVNLQ